jgi:hypothetical protein
MESFGTEINGHLMNHSIDDHSKSILKQPSITRGMHKSEDENAKSLSKINVFDHNNPYVNHLLNNSIKFQSLEPYHQSPSQVNTGGQITPRKQ